VADPVGATGLDLVAGQIHDVIVKLVMEFNQDGGATAGRQEDVYAGLGIGSGFEKAEAVVRLVPIFKNHPAAIRTHFNHSFWTWAATLDGNGGGLGQTLYFCILGSGHRHWILL